MQFATPADTQFEFDQWTTVEIDGTDHVYPTECIKTVYESRTRLWNQTGGEWDRLQWVRGVSPEPFYVHTVVHWPTFHFFGPLPLNLAFNLAQFEGRRITEGEAVQMCQDNRWFGRSLRNPLRGLVRDARKAQTAGAAASQPPAGTDRPADGPGPRMTFGIGKAVVDLSGADLQHGLLVALWDRKNGQPHEHQTVGAVLAAVYGDTGGASERKLKTLVRDTNDKLAVFNAKVRTASATLWLEMPPSP